MSGRAGGADRLDNVTPADASAARGRQAVAVFDHYRHGLLLRGHIRRGFVFQVFKNLAAMRLDIVRISSERNPSKIWVVDVDVDGAVGVISGVCVFDAHQDILRKRETLSGVLLEPDSTRPMHRHVPDTDPDPTPDAEDGRRFPPASVPPKPAPPPVPSNSERKA